ncbi:PqqD family peptide modification chaperone [uncultured Clostridium sp.]|uniref:PqqD family peptide modification chaperone n=1 Tax=uncultured Clostridium sp. TaxID=59620 RepID=UPI0028E9DD83|nr:PqqD family peptide modification chaperone [uncultured Clostridium sp.]
MVKVDSIIFQTNEFDVVDIDKEKVIMNLEKGKYFSLNIMGSRILEMIYNKTRVKEIIESLTKEYDVEEIICEKCVLEYLNDLEKINLIKVI